MKIALSLVVDADLGPVEGVAHFPEEKDAQGRGKGTKTKYPQIDQSVVDKAVAQVVARVEKTLGKEGLSLQSHQVVVHVDDEMAAAQPKEE